MATGGSLELFETEHLNEFQKMNITAIVGYGEQIIVGDLTGGITIFKKDRSKYSQFKAFRDSKQKIETLICLEKPSLLYALSGGNILVYDLHDFTNKTPKDNDKESKDMKDLVKIVRNLNQSINDELLMIPKRKKLLFFYYKTEMQRLIHDEYKDNTGKPLEIPVKEIPDKIKWNGKYICYSLKNSGKLIFLSLDKNNENGITKFKTSEQDIPVDDIAYIQNSWVVCTGGLGLFFGMDGQAINKGIMYFTGEEFKELEVYNDIYIVALYKNSIAIYNYNDSSCVQELTADTSNISAGKFLSKAEKNIYLVIIEKPNEKAKQEQYNSQLWELRELSFETQIKKLLNFHQLDKAFGILNNKLEYNMDKFNRLEKFYCDCAWNSFKQGNAEGYKDAEKYFCLCNFNPFELMYHFITMLNISPIHEGYQDVEKLSKEVKSCQIKITTNDKGELDENCKGALNMLINSLKVKKNYILVNNKIPINANSVVIEKTLTVESFKKIKAKTLSFESTDNTIIDLRKSEPQEPKLSAVMEMINSVLVKAMVLCKTKVELIEDIIENDIFDTNYLADDFLLSNKSYQSDMALAYIYKRQKNFSDALKLLRPYLDDVGNSIANKQSRNLVTKIMVGFGKDRQYAAVFEEGLRYLLKSHQTPAFENLLSHELISVDYFLENIIPDFDKENNDRRENFLRLLCQDPKYSNYSNEKYQTLYIELILEKLNAELSKDYSNINIINEKNLSDKYKKKYKDFKDLLTKHTLYNRKSILEKVKDTWMHDVEIFLLTELKKYEDVLKKMLELVKIGHKEFQQIKDFCRNNYKNDNEIYKKYFRLLKESYENKMNDKVNESMKERYKKEMLKLLYSFIKGGLLDIKEKKTKSKLELLNILKPKEILEMIPGDWKLNEPLDEEYKDKTLFNLLRYYLKEYAVINNNYKRLENLAKMNLTYKQMKLYELKDKHVSLDSNSNCYLCGKKIGNNTIFLVYPNGHIYHNQCSPKLNLEPKTGRNFANFDY